MVRGARADHHHSDTLAMAGHALRIDQRPWLIDWPRRPCARSSPHAITAKKHFPLRLLLDMAEPNTAVRL